MTNKFTTQIKNVRDHGWQRIDLRNCGLTEFPEILFSFEDLRYIDLGNDSYCDEELKNKIEVIPDGIKVFKHLTKLDLSHNEIIDVSEKIVELKSLHYLDLSFNRLVHLSEKIANMEGLVALNLEENPFDLLPPEIVSRGIQSIRNFIKELSEKDFLYEAKLILVGEGRVGKTCIANALISEDYKLEEMESTEGDVTIPPLKAFRGCDGKSAGRGMSLINYSTN